MSFPLLSRVANPGDTVTITDAEGEETTGDFYSTFPPRGRKNGGVILWQLVNADAPERKSSYRAVKVPATEGATARLEHPRK